MSEEILSEFVEELTKRNDVMPRDLIEKYAAKGLGSSEMAAVLLARAALRTPEAPRDAVELSEKRIVELIERSRQSHTDPPASACGDSLGRRIRGALRRLFGSNQG